MNRELFEDLSKSIKEAGKIRRGQAKPSRAFRYDALDIRKLRKSLKVSQSKFARMIGVSVDTVQNWEQGRRRPRGPAMALLRVFEENPKLVASALGEARRTGRLPAHAVRLNDHNDIFTDYIVTYIDLLGQKALLDNLRPLTETAQGRALLKTEDGRKKFEEIRGKTYGRVLEVRNTFENALSIFPKNVLSHPKRKTLSQEDQQKLAKIAKPMSYNFFSDTITIYEPLQGKDELEVRYHVAETLFACSETMLLKFSNGIFFRGGIEIGQGVEFPDGGIYGLALNDAYRLEREIAEYPRIIVGNKLAKLIQNDKGRTEYGEFLGGMNKRLDDFCNTLITEDREGNFFVDFLGKTFAGLCPKYLRVASQKYVTDACVAINKEYAQALSKGDEELSRRYELLRGYYFERLSNWGLEHTTI